MRRQFTINQRLEIRTNATLGFGWMRPLRSMLLVLFGWACGGIRLWRPLFLRPWWPVRFVGSLRGSFLERWLLRLILRTKEEVCDSPQDR